MSSIVPVGGQALIEGVMMRGKKYYTAAVRKPNGRIKVIWRRIRSVQETMPIFKLPFFRGVVVLFEMLVIGMKMLNWSANESLEEEDSEEGSGSGWQIALSMVIAVGFALALFKFLPLFFANLISNSVGGLADNYVWFNVIDGIVKVGIFLLYVYLISFLKDVKILFQYHGSEHAAIHCYEHGKKLTVANVKKFTTLHARCGTSFIVWVILISIIVYTFIPQSASFLEKLSWRILLLPVISGISYEVLRLSAKFEKNPLFKNLYSTRNMDSEDYYI